MTKLPSDTYTVLFPVALQTVLSQRLLLLIRMLTASPTCYYCEFDMAV